MPYNSCSALYVVSPSKTINHPFDLTGKSNKHDAMAGNINTKQMLGSESRSNYYTLGHLASQ